MTKIYQFICYVCLIGLLSVIYFACFNYAEAGYGYPGYRGFTHHHSHFYYAGHDYNYNSSVRETSVGGHGFSKKGIHGGK